MKSAPAPTSALRTSFDARADVVARSSIQRSWRRSCLSGVDPDLGALAEGTGEVGLNTELDWAAAPVLADLESALGAPALIVLSDAEARLTRFWAPESTIRARFETVGAYPGAGAAEEQIGTNAIGTALEEGRSIVVVGREHYQHTFERITCAAALVRNPVTKRKIGAIALAMLDHSGGEDLLALTMRASRAVEQRLLERVTAADRLLLEALKARSGGAQRCVVGVSRDMMMANEPGMRLLPRLDQAMLWERARETVETGRERTVDILVGADVEPVSVRCVPVRNADVTIGALIDFGTSESASGRRRPAIGPARGNVGASAPGPDALIGHSREACSLTERIAAAASSAGSVLVSGEPGAGKAAVARSLLRRRFPSEEASVVNCSDPEAVQNFAADMRLNRPVILTHVELLDAGLAYRLRDRVRSSPQAHDFLVATMDTTEAGKPIELPLISELGSLRLDVPCLRYRREDIAPLAEHFAREAGGGSRRISPEAMQLLLRYPWPGNIRELRSVVEGAARLTRANIELEDLPGELRRLATRRPLSPLEQAEADAILAALRACGNNKVQAAALLQISRSRLYRKASAYGLVGAVLG